MWPETPEQRLQMIRQDNLQRQLEARRRPLPETGRSRDNGFSGLHVHLGRIIVVIGRTLCEEDARASPHPVLPDRPGCSAGRQTTGLGHSKHAPLPPRQV